jgi:glycosyltransferase involved in cell wall biosynthesis
MSSNKEYDSLKNKKCLVVSKFSSLGGGEKFLLESMKHLSSVGMSVYFISFYDHNNKEHEKYNCLITEFNARIINVQNGMTFKNLMNWIRLINPDIVHTQGENRYMTMTICNILNISIIQGYHFWSNAILLNSTTANRDILKYKSYHSKSPDFDEIVEKSQAIYVVSDFMKEVFKEVINYEVKYVIEPVPLKELCVPSKKTTKQFVTFINIHKYKGGQVLLHYLKNFSNIPFLAVRTEPNSESLDNEIKDLMMSRDNCLFLERTDIRKVYSQSKIVVIASICDETYCRVCVEAVFNNIPTICSNKGNIKNIIKDAGVYIDLEDTKTWDDALTTLYYNDEVYNNLIIESKRRSSEITSENSKKKFIQMFVDSINTNKCVMLFSPWCDMGLGIQTKNYVSILKKYNIDTCIFAFKPYSNIGQRDPNEWLHDRIYYSPNIREQVKDSEIIEFVQKYKISKCLIPETCFDKVFYLAKLLKKFNIVTYAIPNIEIVRKKEINHHKEFTKILCNNNLCLSKFSEYEFDNLIYLGYAIPPKDFTPRVNYHRMKFLLLGGNNAFTRKRVLEVLDAFSQLKSCDLIACIQIISDEQRLKIEKYDNLVNISIILKSLSCNEIDELYKSCDCVIQVSSHEGLGLGFYEALSYGLPVLTVNSLPHTEIIENDKTGIIIPCKSEDMKDNNDGLVKGCIFNPQDMISAIRGLSIKKLDRLKKNCINVRGKLYNEFEERFIRIIKN